MSHERLTMHLLLPGFSSITLHSTLVSSTVNTGRELELKGHTPRNPALEYRLLNMMYSVLVM